MDLKIKNKLRMKSINVLCACMIQNMHIQGQTHTQCIWHQNLNTLILF